MKKDGCTVIIKNDKCPNAKNFKNIEKVHLNPKNYFMSVMIKVETVYGTDIWIWLHFTYTYFTFRRDLTRYKILGVSWARNFR